MILFAIADMNITIITTLALIIIIIAIISTFKRNLSLFSLIVQIPRVYDKVKSIDRDQRMVTDRKTSATPRMSVFTSRAIASD